MANRQALHVLAQLGSEKQDLWWSAAQLEDASVLQPSRHAVENRRRECGENANGPRRLLPSPCGPNRQGESRNGHCAAAPPPVLQGPPLWHGPPRPRGLALRGTLPVAR